MFLTEQDHDTFLPSIVIDGHSTDCHPGEFKEDFASVLEDETERTERIKRHQDLALIPDNESNVERNGYTDSGGLESPDDEVCFGMVSRWCHSRSW